MPVYVYKCQECGKKQEVFQKTYDEEQNLSCGECGSENIKKIMAAPSIGSSNSFEMPDAPSCATGNCPTGMCGLN